ncbi:MAG: hypothetical protein ABJJ53_17665 [Sulfitobacter sp.]
MNQIINMIMRTVMRKLLNKGIDAGFNKAASMRGGPKKQAKGEIDDYGNPVAQHTQRSGGSSNKGAQQAKQAMKMARRINKF